MAFQLDDLLKDDKKDSNLIPDLSKATCNSKEEFRRLFERCPEFKIKPEKVKKEETKIRDKDFSWKATRKELRVLEREWNYGNPIPMEMRELNLRELQQVAIDWRMLTSIRPDNSQDEEMFSRLVEMGKLEAKTLLKEKRLFRSPIRRSKNRAGIIESSVKICAECGEEFCFGESCGDILYDSFIRVTVTSQQVKPKVTADTEAIIAGMGPSGKKKRKKRTKSKIRTSKKIPQILARNKSRKSTKNDAEKSGKDREADMSGNSTKPFKRKCSKYRKKSFTRK
ncbi:uncharacterized protein [Prorops nasuta]|uniref:uncharacterized protein n=1 Tax=Prorops nasuta TaxID=863751 RepID=UPI0034CF9C10